MKIKKFKEHVTENRGDAYSTGSDDGSGLYNKPKRGDNRRGDANDIEEKENDEKPNVYSEDSKLTEIFKEDGQYVVEVIDGVITNIYMV